MHDNGAEVVGFIASYTGDKTSKTKLLSISLRSLIIRRYVTISAYNQFSISVRGLF